EVLHVSIAQAGEIDHSLAALDRVFKAGWPGRRRQGRRIAIGKIANPRAKVVGLNDQIIGLGLVGGRVYAVAVELDVVRRSQVYSVARLFDRDAAALCI